MVGHDDHLGREVPLFHIRPFPLVGWKELEHYSWSPLFIFKLKKWNAKIQTIDFLLSRIPSSDFTFFDWSSRLDSWIIFLSNPCSFLDALASLDSKLSVSQSVIDVFQLAHLRVCQSYFFIFSPDVVVAVRIEEEPRHVLFRIFALEERGGGRLE